MSTDFQNPRASARGAVKAIDVAERNANGAASNDELAADRARNVNKAERAIEREAERALDLQIKHQNLPGSWA